MTKLAAITVILPAQIGDRIENFWNQFGIPGRAMVAQPVYRDGSWNLKMIMADESLAIAIEDILNKASEPSNTQ